MFKRIGLTVVLLHLLGAPCPAGLGGLEESFDFGGGQSGRIDYGAGFVEATSIGTADVKKMANSVQAEAVARRTARHLAYEVLAETVGKIQVDAKTLYQDAIVAVDALKTETHAVIRGAQIVKDEFQWATDPMTQGMAPKATVTLRLYLTGEEGLAHLLDKHVPPGGGYQAAPPTRRATATTTAPLPPAPVAPVSAAPPAPRQPPVAAPAVALSAVQPPREAPVVTKVLETPAPAAVGPASAPAAQPAAEGAILEKAATVAPTPDPTPKATPAAEAEPVAAAVPAEPAAAAPAAETQAAAPPRVLALVIDGRDLDPGYRPALRPYLRSESGEVVYGPEMVSPSLVLKQGGYVRYASSPDSARSVFEGEGEVLVVKAVGAPEKGEILLGDDDAKAVAQAAAASQFLREGHVLLVVR